MADTRSRTGRHAEVAASAVVAVAVAVLISAEASGAATVAAIAPTAVLAAGGICAFVQTYLTWRNGGEWRIWQGAGWALFILMTLCAAFGASSLMTG
jgi:hypothetical protein